MTDYMGTQAFWREFLDAMEWTTSGYLAMMTRSQAYRAL